MLTHRALAVLVMSMMKWEMVSLDKIMMHSLRLSKFLVVSFVVCWVCRLQVAVKD